MRAITRQTAEPQATAETPQPGFAIYYDVDNYTMVKDGDVTYIRPYQKPMTREEVLEAYGDYLSQLPDEERNGRSTPLYESPAGYLFAHLRNRDRSSGYAL